MILDQLNEIDETKTIQMAKKMLLQYRRLNRIATPAYKIIDFEGLSIKQKRQYHEAQINRQQEAQTQLKAFDEAIQQVDEPYRTALKIRYQSKFELNAEQYAERSMVSRSQFFRRIQCGTLQFAEVFQNGMLLQFKK